MTADLGTFCLVVGVLVLVGIYRSRRITSDSAYLFADRDTSWFSLTATLVMTEFNSATLISFASVGYIAGFWALLLPLIFLFGLLFYAVTVAKKWKAFNGNSVAGFFTEKYGSTIGRGTSALLLLAMMGFSSVYVKSLTLIFAPLLPSLGPWVLSGMLMSVILIMATRGGLIAVIRTDIVSFLFMIIGFPLVAMYLWKSVSLPSVSFQTVMTFGQSQGVLPLQFVVSLIVLSMFTYILAPWYGQKIFAAKSEKVAYWSVISAAVLVFVLYGSAIVATALFRYRGYECDVAQEALPSLISQCLPVGCKGVAYALLFATSATTLTGVWSAMASMWKSDFGIATDEYQSSIMATITFSMISYVLANTFVDQVFDKMILANIPVAALSFGLLAGFYWKHVSRIGVFISIMVGCVCGVSAYLVFGEAGGYTWYWAMYGIPCTFAAGFIGSLLFREKRLPITH